VIAALARLRDARRLVGGRSLFLSAVQWRVRREYLVLTRDIRQPLPSSPDMPGLACRPLRPEDLPALLALDPLESAAGVGRRLAAGQRCVVSFLGAVPVHRHWYTTRDRDVPYLGLTLRALEGDVLGCGVYTRPDVRGRGIVAAGVAAILDEARREERRRMVVLVAALNHASRRALGKVGFVAAGTIGFWPPLGKRRHFTTGDVVRAARGFRVRSRP
jgi:GNAT superfamily N-acetyltransferase